VHQLQLILQATNIGKEQIMSPMQGIRGAHTVRQVTGESSKCTYSLKNSYDNRARLRESCGLREDRSCHTCQAQIVSVQSLKSRMSHITPYDP
jgi:hypothetical protein